jgi:hypothetical protein
MGKGTKVRRGYFLRNSGEFTHSEPSILCDECVNSMARDQARGLTPFVDVMEIFHTMDDIRKDGSPLCKHLATS